jgi:monoamine oxidase
MLDTAIVGGGLSGVALARSLRRQGHDVALFEARPRLGGRILSTACAGSGAAIDLGPGWFWPDTQPLLTQLVADLGLEHFPQHDTGTLLHLRECDKTPERIESQQVHNGARRVAGGMARLIDALAAELPRERVHLGHVLAAARDRGDHIALEFRVADRMIEIAARRVVLAIPPRLVQEHVRFLPALDETIQQALRMTATWMAAQAKVAIGYERPYWREAGLSGNAFVTHEQAVIGEIFDACDQTAGKAVLAGFLALSPELRRSFQDGLPMLMDSQMAQVFGGALERGEQHYQDWAVEPHTCSAQDLASPATAAGPCNPMLRRALWDEKLYFGGSETASRAAGYLEGALEAAGRLLRTLGRVSPAATIALASLDDTAAVNVASLARFRVWVAAQGETAFDVYHQRVRSSLAAQQREQVTQRAFLATMEEVYGKALGVLDDLAFETRSLPIEHGRSALMPDVQEPFRDFMQALLDDVIAFNQTSCALSNFPDEHKPSKEYVQAILRDVAAAWREFSLSANRMLLAKAASDDGAPQRQAAVLSS